MNKFVLIVKRALLPVFLFVTVTTVILQSSQKSALAATYETHLDALYQKSFDEILGNLAQVETDLSKLLVVSSPQQYTLLLSEVWRTTGATCSVLGQIPASYVDFSPLTQFVCRSGDYCYQLMKKVSAGTPVTQEDLDQILQMHNASVQINAQLQEARSTNAATFDLSAINSDYYGGDTNSTLTFEQEEGENKYPHLIYDGPFSESTEMAQPLGLGDVPCDLQTAQQIATQFLMGELQGELTHIGDTDGHIPVYDFEGKTGDGRTVQINITKTGGKVLWMRIFAIDYSQVPTSARNDAIPAAGTAYLKQKGIGDFEPTYGQYYGGYALINYVPIENGVMLYADLIKLWIELDSCRVVGIDTNNYLFAHKERAPSAPSLTPEQAQQKLSSSLSVQTVKLALIPFSASDERLCFEFKCTYGESDFIVYINAQTGAEEEIYQIIENEGGQLVL